MIVTDVIKLSEIGTYSTFKKNLEQKKCTFQFLPHSLLEFSNNKTFLYNGIKLKTAYIVDIIHNLILKYYFKKENKFHLHSLILKEKYGYLYNKYIDFLLEKKILILLAKHQKGKNSRVYAINEYILRGNIIRYYNYDTVLLKKYKNKVTQFDDKNESNLIDTDIKDKLVNDLFKVEIQFDRSIFFLDSTINDIDVYNRNKYSVECIKDGHIFYHFDNYGRMHTNFTILKSTIRKNCLLINGEETCELDINNSQPLFLSKLIHDVDTKWVDADELELFKYLTINGCFYKYLMDQMNIKDRKTAKEYTYRVLFGRNGANSKADKVFSKVFPTIHNFIKLYKKEHNDYRILAYELQKSESNLIFNKIIREIMNHYDIPIITIHDSIVIQKSYKDRVYPIFKTKLLEEFGEFK